MDAGPRVLIPHIDDVACALGANRAMFGLPRHSVVTSGSVMVPAAWFPDAARRVRQAASKNHELDLGVHLVLTSESEAFRWAPVAPTGAAGGLIGPDGYMWRTVAELRAHADPAAVAIELRAQIDRALAAGIDVTHLDHHMGAALAPEFVHGTAAVAQDYRLPMLFPSNLDSYLSVLEMGPVDRATMDEARTALEEDGLAVGDTFLMGLAFQHEPDPPATMRCILSDLPDGATYLSLHCAAPGDVEVVHPGDAHWRLAEYDVVCDAAFSAWVHDLPVELHGMRAYRDAARAGA